MFDKKEEKKFRVVCNSEREGEGVNIKEDAFKVISISKSTFTQVETLTIYQSD